MFRERSRAQGRGLDCFPSAAGCDIKQEGWLGDPETCVCVGGVEAPCCSNSGLVTLWHRSTVKNGASCNRRSIFWKNRQVWAALEAFLHRL